MRKNLVNTIILFISTFLLIGGSITISQALSKEEVSEKMSELSLADEEVAKLMERVTRTTLLREPNYYYENVKEETQIAYIYQYLKMEDYSLIKVIPKKIICEVTEEIKFVSSSPCIVKVIANHVFEDYQYDFFHTKKELKYAEFTINGSLCKYDGSHYYCLLEKKEAEPKTYSLIKSAFQTEENIIIYEYYLKTNNEQENEFGVNEGEIKEKGVLFNHNFTKSEEGEYFLESSTIA